MRNRGQQIEVLTMLDIGSDGWPRGRPSPEPDEPLVIAPLACSLDEERLVIHLKRNVWNRDEFQRRSGQTLLSMTELYRHNKMRGPLKVRTIYVT
jgi:hypothetical protein